MSFPDHHQIIIYWFPRLIGAMYFIALFPFVFQIRGLIGSRGILPAHSYLSFLKSRIGKKRYYRIPTLFWINSSDHALMAAVFFGLFCAACLAAGLSPPLLIPPLILIHLSIITVGQDFLSFGWEMFFLEISYNTFLLTLTSQPNPLVWVSLNLLIFRFHFEAGYSKLASGDPNWRNLTAIYYHYQTQPLPNAIAWYIHKLPFGFHRATTALMFFIELAVPFAIFGPEQARLAAFVLLFLLQVNIALSGSYSYLNLLTATLVTLLISDTYLAPFLSAPVLQPSTFGIIDAIVTFLAAGLIVSQILQLANHFLRYPWISSFLYSIYPYHFANRYGIFAIMTTTRYEIVIEGSEDGREWREYHYHYKPSEVNRRPRQIAPYQPRLDWQTWFLPFTSYGHEAWFQNFLYRLLTGERDVLKLLRHNPFPDMPPKYIRAQLYVYEFSTYQMKKETEQWWVRTYVDQYSPSLQKKPA